MATKRIKSFSPYKYSVQYAKAGEGPNQQPHPYVNAAVLPEEHMVIAKKDPNWFVYVANTAIYSLDEDCTLIPTKVTSEMSIVGKSENVDEINEIRLTEIEEDAIDSLKLDLTQSGSTSFLWTTSKSVEISHMFNSNADCIVIADGEYIKVFKNIVNPNKLLIRFSDDFTKSNYQTITAIVYSINDSLHHEAVKHQSQLSYDRINNVISCENEFHTNKCIPLVFNDKNWSYVFENIDLTPNRILLDADNITVIRKTDVDEELVEVNQQIEQIMNDNQLTPFEILVNENEDFKRTYRKKRKTVF